MGSRFTCGSKITPDLATFNTPGGFNEKKYQNNCGQPSQRWGEKYHEPEYWKFGEEGNQYFRHATGQIYVISKDLATYTSINGISQVNAYDILGKIRGLKVGSGSWSPQYKAAGLSTRRVSLLCIAYFCLGVFVVNRPDVLGQFMPLVGMEWSQIGVAHLFSAIKMFKMKEEMKKVTKKLTLLE
ncbi:hypothetical protein P3L10_000624 [Capsicum annuum]